MTAYSAAAGGAAAAQAIAVAIKASGAIVKMEPKQFQRIIDRTEDSLVVTASGGFIKKKHNYLTSYKGLFFYTSSAEPLRFSTRTEIVAAQKIWIP